MTDILRYSGVLKNFLNKLIQDNKITKGERYEIFGTYNSIYVRNEDSSSPFILVVFNDKTINIKLSRCLYDSSNDKIEKNNDTFFNTTVCDEILTYCYIKETVTY